MCIAKECRSVSRIWLQNPCSEWFPASWVADIERVSGCDNFDARPARYIMNQHHPASDILLSSETSVIIDGKKQHAQILSHQSLTGPRQRNQKHRDIHHSPTPSIRACRCPLSSDGPSSHVVMDMPIISYAAARSTLMLRTAGGALARRANPNVHRSSSLVVQFHGAITFPACGLSNRLVLLYLDNLFCCRAPRKCATEKYSMCACGFSHGIQFQESNRFKRIKNGIGCALRYHANGQEKI